MAEFKTAEKIRNIKNGNAMKMASHFFVYIYVKCGDSYHIFAWIGSSFEGVRSYYVQNLKISSFFSSLFEALLCIAWETLGKHSPFLSKRGHGIPVRKLSI